MTEDQRYELTVLAEALHDATRSFQALAMMNTPTDPDAARQARIDLELARAEMWEAEARLTRAQMRVAGRLL